MRKHPIKLHLNQVCFEKRTKLVSENKAVTISSITSFSHSRQMSEKGARRKRKNKAMLEFTVYDEEIDIYLKHFYAITMQIISLTKEKLYS